MKIYTRTGDNGTTGLYGGQRVSKTDVRIATYGTLDETNSAIGMVRSLLPAALATDLIQDELVGIQHHLFNIGGYLANAVTLTLPEAAITALEQSIDRMTAELPELKAFILPSGHAAASATHVARTICRRAEREVIGLADTVEVPEAAVKYLNRLSDWLFTLARYINLRTGTTETIWQK